MAAKIAMPSTGLLIAPIVLIAGFVPNRQPVT